MRVIQAIDVRWYNACAYFALTQALALQRMGHEVLLMADPGSPPANKALEMGLTLDESVYFSSFNIAGSLLKFKRIINNYRPDIILAHRGESHLLGALAGRINKVPVVRFRGDVRLPGSDPFSKILNEKLTRGIIVSTGKLKEMYISRYNLNGIPVDVIYPGLDLSRFAVNTDEIGLREKFDIDPDHFVIGIVGRLSPVKGHRFLLEAVGKVLPEFPNIKIIIAAEEAQINNREILDLASGIGIDNIVITGRVENIEQLISVFDIGVVSSIGSEMICRVLLEYYAAGIAAVGTRINQIEEIINISGAGILVEPGDPDSLAEAILKLARDESLRKTHGRKAREWIARNGSLDSLGKNTDKFLERVLNG
jgi:glycosyltransferase involved in cell wall biosynthesis